MTDGMVRDFWSQRRFSAPMTERRTLEPICAAIQTHSFKLALQLCQKSLRIKPYNPIVQTLQAVTLHRTGQLKDALAQIEEIVKDVRGNGKALEDPELLLFCSYIYEQNGKDDSSEELWQRALSLHPNNIQLAAEACYFFIRIGAFAALQETCLRLITEKQLQVQNPELYQHMYWYTLMSIILQVRQSYPPEPLPTSSKNSEPSATSEQSEKARASDVEKANSLLDSAIKLLQPDSSVSLADEPASRGDSHKFMSVIRILQLKLENSEDKTIQHQLLQLLESEEGVKLSSNNLDVDLAKRELQLAYGSKDTYNALWDRMKQGLVEKHDTNWSSVDTLVRAAYAHATASSDQQGIKCESWWSEAASSEEAASTNLLIQTRQILESLAKGEHGANKSERGYALGLLRLYTFKQSAPVGGKTIEDLIVSYFERFADKNCCYEDLRPYLEILDASSREAVVSELQQRFPIDVSTLKALQISINAEKILRLLNVHFGSIEDELAKAAQYQKAYFDSLHFGKDYLATDLQPSDDFALLAGQAYLGAWQQSHGMAHLEQAIAILEFAIRKSKYRFQIRVLLIRLYRLLGATSLVLHHFGLLDVKQIQFDSLSHFAFERGSQFTVNDTAVASAQKSVANGTAKGNKTYSETVAYIANWYTQADNEVMPSIVQAWNNQAYSIIEEYQLLQTRLKHSLTRHMMRFENLRSRTMKETPSSPEQLEAFRSSLAQIETDGLYDNRDYSVLPNHQPLEALHIESQTRLGPRTQTKWLSSLHATYIAFATTAQLDKAVELSEQEGTAIESAFLAWAQEVTAWLAGATETIEDVAFLGFFKRCQADVQAYDLASPLWELQHVAQAALEAYSLVDLAFVISSANLGANSKALKQFKRLKQDLKPALKAISMKLKAVVEDMSKRYKGRNKLDNLLPIFDGISQVSDDLLLDIATQLLESRKNALTQQATSITKRIAST